MNFHPMTYQLFGNRFVTQEMKAVFDEPNDLQKILDIEVALAEKILARASGPIYDHPGPLRREFHLTKRGYSFNCRGIWRWEDLNGSRDSAGSGSST
jgi:hypothetical protein